MLDEPREGQALDSLGEGVPKWTSARRRQKAVSLWLTGSDLQGSHGCDECGPGLHPHPGHSPFGEHHLLPSHSLLPPSSHTARLELSGAPAKGGCLGGLSVQLSVLATDLVACFPPKLGARQSEGRVGLEKGHFLWQVESWIVTFLNGEIAPLPTFRPKETLMPTGC